MEKKIDRKLLYLCRVEYLYEQGFSGHINNVSYWYRKKYNIHRGMSAMERHDIYKAGVKSLPVWMRVAKRSA